jgi:hypothetical protein
LVQAQALQHQGRVCEQVAITESSWECIVRFPLDLGPEL